VTVFGSLGVVDPPALIAKPTNDVVIKIEDDEEVQGDMDVGGTSDTSVLPPKEGNGITRKRTRGVNNHSEGGNASKRHSSVAKNSEKKRPDAIPRTSRIVGLLRMHQQLTTLRKVKEP